MTVRLAGLELANPVIAASGTFGYGIEFEEIVSLEHIGGFVTKGISLEPMPGHKPQRIVETAAGMLNAIGLQNPGLRHFLDVDLPFLRRYETAVIVNVVGHTREEFLGVVQGLAGQAGIAAVELNISCPNVEHGLLFSQEPELAAGLVAAVRRATALPLIVKISPNVTDPVALGRACAEAGADALSAINTLVGLAIDVERRRPVLANGTGGLSGPAVKPVGLRVVYDLAAALDVPVVGMGGIETGRDALEYLMAGARAVAVGTAVFRDPLAPPRIVEELQRELEEQGLAGPDDAWAAANPKARGRQR